MRVGNGETLHVPTYLVLRCTLMVTMVSAPNPPLRLFDLAVPVRPSHQRVGTL
jgi:hypothetical protein